jgi:hypothetical protein
MKTGFIYIWFDKKHKRYYLGSHLGSEDDGYVCSSTWMKSSYKRRPSDFRRRILRRGIEKKYLKEREYDWLKLIKPEELGRRYYNLNNKKILKPGNWPEGRARPEETRRKVSEGLKRAYENGLKPWNKGIALSENRKKQISEDTKRGMAEISGEKKEAIKKTQFQKGVSSWNKGLKNWRTISTAEIEKRKELAIMMHKEGKFGNKGRSWFTDGKTNLMLFPKDEVPFGFYKGRVFHD